ncbi:hypothetical protein BH11PSE4_BH11PSE4_32620 [soil metagenome]
MIAYDPRKRAVTLRERGLDLQTDPAKVFSRRTANRTDDLFGYGEVRTITAGWLDGRMVNVVWTQRGAARHVISMRYCHAKEQRKLLVLFT